jgi:hypothetical protein
MTLAAMTDKVVSFLVGLVLGVLAALATFGGRIASLETSSAIQSKEISEVHAEVSRVSDEILTILRARAP